MISYGVRNALLCMLVTFSSVCNVGVISYALLGKNNFAVVLTVLLIVVLVGNILSKLRKSVTE